MALPRADAENFWVFAGGQLERGAGEIGLAVHGALHRIGGLLRQLQHVDGVVAVAEPCFRGERHGANEDQGGKDRVSPNKKGWRRMPTAQVEDKPPRRGGDGSGSRAGARRPADFGALRRRDSRRCGGRNRRAARSGCRIRAEPRMERAENRGRKDRRAPRSGRARSIESALACVKSGRSCPGLDPGPAPDFIRGRGAAFDGKKQKARRDFAEPVFSN
jgi:hypothetical protein